MHLSGNHLLDCSQRRCGPSGIGAARLRHIGASPTSLATKRYGSSASEFYRVEAARQIGGDANDYRRLPLGTRHNGDDAGTDAPLQIIGERFELAPGNAVDDPTVEGDIANPLLGWFVG